MTKERIEDFREIILPFVKKRLLEINYENLGESDAEEFEKDFNEILDLAIKTLEQEPKTGHWIKSEIKNATHCVCSECGDYWDITGDLFAFCPNCGAKMVEPQDSEVDEGI